GLLRRLACEKQAREKPPLAWLIASLGIREASKRKNHLWLGLLRRLACEKQAREKPPLAWLIALLGIREVSKRKLYSTWKLPQL
ncbi:MAG TPA: hypothetical protein PK537_00760, partial [Candidatus Limiplasma sp.]|nr:hypothetical protein [Candidatus Limiplasma sp.]